MPRDSSGNYTLPAGNPVVTNTPISSVWANTTLTDVSTAITQSLNTNGTATVAANIPMAGFKFTGLGNGTAPGDSVNFAQLTKVANYIPSNVGQDGKFLYTFGGVNSWSSMPIVPDYLLIAQGVI